MFSHFLLFHIPVGLLLIFRVPSSVQQQLLPCEDNYNNNNNNSKINAVNNNNNKSLGTQSKSAAFQDSLGGVGPLVHMYDVRTLWRRVYYTEIYQVLIVKKQVRIPKSKKNTTKHIYIYMYIMRNWYQVSYIRPQVPSVIRHTTTKASGTRYKIWILIIFIHTRYQFPGTRHDMPYVGRNGYVRNHIFQLIYSCYRWHGTSWYIPQPKSWHQREIPAPAWTSPVQLEDISRASSTNSTLFWTRAEVGGAAK